MKCVASIIYHDTIELFKKSCKTVNNINNTNDLITNQFQNKEKGINDIKINPNSDSRYQSALKQYISNKSKKEKIIQGEDPLAVVEKLYRKFPKLDPDTQINDIEFIQMNLYKSSELTAYYTLAKENNFDFSKKILEWAKKLMKLIYNKS